MNGEAVRLKIDVAYVGTAFHGWQIQLDLRTVQGELARATSRLLGRDVIPVGAGRTDAGVHARGQSAHLTVAGVNEAERLERALAGIVPDDMEVRAVTRVSPDFNARFSATARRYAYQVLMGRDLFRPHYWPVWGELDRQAMDAAAAAVVGAHDFSSFCKAASLKADHNVCIVDLCRFDWSGDSAIFHVRANRFLHHMVRILVGTLVEIGKGQRPADDMPRILEACSRSSAGKMAPSQGLFLEEVTYPETVLDPAWREPRANSGISDSPGASGIRIPEGESP